VISSMHCDAVEQATPDAVLAGSAERAFRHAYALPVSGWLRADTEVYLR